MDAEKFKKLYKGRFNCQKTFTLGLLYWAAQNIPDNENILAMAGFCGFNRGNSTAKTNEGVLTITEKALYFFTSALPFIPFPYDSGAVPLRHIESIEINGMLTQCLTIRIANVPYNFYLVDHSATIQATILDAKEKLKN